MTLVIRGVRLVDGMGGEPRDDMTVLVEDDRILTVEPTTPHVPRDVDIDVVDGHGLTLTPGLIDAHVHVGYPLPLDELLSGSVSVAEHAAAIFDTVGDTLEQGFTAIRDVAGLDGGVIAAIDKRGVRGPRIRCAGAALVQTGGHGHMCPAWEPDQMWEARSVPGLAMLTAVVDSPDDVRRAARTNFRRGAHFLKMCVTGGVISLHDNLSDTQFTVPEIRAAVEEATARGSYVTVHAHNNAGIRNAVAAGVRCIEHGSELDEETARLLVDHDVALVPTLAIHAALEKDVEAMGFPPEVAQRVLGKVEQGTRATRIAAQAGVRLGLGSDLATNQQDFRGLELVLRAEAQNSMQALVSATRSNAQIMGLADEIGTVQPGKLADLTLWDGDPLADPEIFNTRSRAVLVLKGGQRVKDLTRGGART